MKIAMEFLHFVAPFRESQEKRVGKIQKKAQNKTEHPEKWWTNVKKNLKNHKINQITKK